MVILCWVFFFQAEDGIRDYDVTGVQTCALPICNWHRPSNFAAKYLQDHGYRVIPVNPMYDEVLGERSEERRVGKECRSRWSPYH